MSKVSFRTSSAVRNLEVSLLRGTAKVEFQNGRVYNYTGVSRRAIANLLLNPNMSLGFWVGENCVTYLAGTEFVAV